MSPTPNPKPATAPVERLTYRFSEVAEQFGVSERTLLRHRSSGKFPKPDLRIGRSPLWTRETLVRWIAEQGAK